MAPLAILLLIKAQGGSLAVGGLLCALYGLASAIGQPLLGRRIDRHGQTTVTTVATISTTTALLILACTRPANHLVAATVLVVVAGLSTPPLEAGLRALWPTVLPDEERRRTALALDTGSQGLIYIAGPPVTVALTTSVGAGTALILTALAGAAGAALVLTAPASRGWRPTGSRASFLGPLHHRGLRRLFAALTGVGFALGALTVLAVDAAGRHHARWLAGTAPAALSVGSVAAGILLAHHPRPGRPAQQLLAATTGFAAGWLPLLTNPSPATLVVAVLVPGAFLTPLITNAFLTTEQHAPVGTVTEAFAWLIAAVGTGQAAGTALAGLATARSPLVLAALPVLGAAFTLTVLLASRRHIDPAPRPTS